ncbi:MAG: DMT family transporter [Acidimicrobiia bacterium]|nr:DMT family transporter [Acidimicrobiia bacterium]
MPSTLGPSPASEPVPAPRSAAAHGAGERLGVPAVLLATIAWGSGSVATKVVTASSMSTVMVRLWLGVPIGLSLWALRRRWPTWASLRRCIPGGILFGLHVSLFFSALKLTSVANVTFIGALQPVIVLLVAGRWLGERVTARIVVLSVTAMAGVALIVYGNEAVPGALAGDLLAVANIVVWTVFFLYTKRARHHVETIDYQATMTVIAAAVVTPVALLLGASASEIDGYDWFWLVFIALVPGTLGHLMMNWAHRFVDATVSSIVILAVPAVAAVGAALFIDEPLTAIQVVGGAIVLASVGTIVARTPRDESAALAVAEVDSP